MFTFEKVEQFGILNANVVFNVSDSGYINAKIQVIDRREQVNGYEAPESEVEGWANDSAQPQQQAQPQTQPKPQPQQEQNPNYVQDDDLPF